MNVLLLDATPASGHPSAAAADALEAAFNERSAPLTRVTLRDLDLRPCNGCFGCWVTRPGQCLIDDDARGIAARVIAADVVALCGPIRFGTWGSLAKVAIDRMIGLVLPHFTRIDGEIHHRPRYERYPRRVSLGVMAKADPESEALFRRLAERNAINFHCPAYAAGVMVEGEDGWPVAKRLVGELEGRS